ncbi:unnamed protein product [Orchesella dallaii]|uniref:Secreted protein n=1 Tax=Orchesella dallaii TaxID=48710 RepID=A0ABP1PNQ9_9HEXA
MNFNVSTTAVIIVMIISTGFVKSEISKTTAEITNADALNIDYHKIGLQMSTDEHFLFEDNPDDHELARRGCCRCGNGHHCCGNMCHGKK